MTWGRRPAWGRRLDAPPTDSAPAKDLVPADLKRDSVEDALEILLGLVDCLVESACRSPRPRCLWVFLDLIWLSPEALVMQSR